MRLGRLANLSSLGLLLAGLVGCGVPAPSAATGEGHVMAGQSLQATDYFPLRPTTRWTYQVEDKLNRISGERSARVREYSTQNGESAQLVFYADGQEVTRQRITKTADAITWDAYGLSLDLNHLDKPGRLSEKQGRIVDYQGLETVETPAGRFEKCLKIEIQVNERMGRKAQEYRKVDHLWLAPGVGPVKRVYEEGYTDPKVGAWSKDLIVSLLTQFQR